eukprot:SAG11_NODE_26521_length_344_cov_0.632653_1_plen_42_part_10
MTFPDIVHTPGRPPQSILAIHMNPMATGRQMYKYTVLCPSHG